MITARATELRNYYGVDFEKFEGITPDELNDYDEAGNTLLISTVLSKGISSDLRKYKMRWLIGAGADVDRRDNGPFFMTPLQHSVRVEDFDIFLFLIMRDRINLNAVSFATDCHANEKGFTALMLACRNGNEDMVRILCADPRISINQQNFCGETALIIAAQHKQDKCMQELLRAGADESLYDHSGKTWRDYQLGSINY